MNMMEVSVWLKITAPGDNMTPPTQEEMLHELWYLRRRVRQLEKQLQDLAQPLPADKAREQFERESE